jgi:hypothetical protein
MGLSINLVYVRNSLCWLWEINYPKTAWYLLVLTKFILSAHTNNEGVLIHFNDFSSINLTRISTTIFTFCFNWTTLHHGSRHCGQSHQQPSTLFKKKMNIQRLRKRATFFLASSLLLSIERIKNKNETDVLLKRWLWTGSFKRVYNNRDDSFIRTLYPTTSH